MRTQEENYALIEHLFRKKYWYFWRVAYNITSSREIAEDAVQQSFLVLLKNHHRIKSPEHASILMTKIVKYQCYNWYKRENKGVKVREEAFLSILEYNATLPEYGKLDTYPLSQHIINKIPTLSSRKALVVKLFLNGVDATEAGKRLGVGQSTMSQQLRKALEQLREKDYRVTIKERTQQSHVKSGETRKQHTQTRLEYIHSLKDEGLTNKEIDIHLGERIGYTCYSLHRESIEGISPENRTQFVLRKETAKMKVLRDMGMSLKEIAKIFKCTISNVSLRVIRYLRTISEFPEDAIEIDINDPWYQRMYDVYHIEKKIIGNNRKLEVEDVKKIKRFLKKKSVIKIAEDMNMSISAIKAIRSGKTWSHIAV